MLDQPKSYLYNSADADGLIHRIVHETTTCICVGMGVVVVLATGRLGVQKKHKDEI